MNDETITLQVADTPSGGVFDAVVEDMAVVDARENAAPVPTPEPEPEPALYRRTRGRRRKDPEPIVGDDSAVEAAELLEAAAAVEQPRPLSPQTILEMEAGRQALAKRGG